ncbi:phasin family protein [Ferrimonas marina]|uniref:Phasin family protein n=1 Tax=Ferrimonas marina TaxID=299255 RepID=A0A1M5XEE2_9GAMM|nr:phasin family protein [Ferrimonas marina]SHH98022.1 phasin family protein [Ferrimonas marina]
MENELFKQWDEQLKTLSAPWMAYNQTLVASMEKWTEIQLEAANYYGGLAIEQMHNAGQQPDLPSLVQQQTELLQAVGARWQSDMQQFSGLAQDTQQALQALVFEHSPLKR